MSFVFKQGTLPLLISMPHNGSFIPPDIQATMTAAGKSSRDTDWLLDRLYDLPGLDQASKLIAQWSRYVIDLNRPADNASLYPGQATTGLVSDHCFDGSPIYVGELPGAIEVQRRIEAVWKPYHAAIEGELDRLMEEFGHVVLVEAHSIAARVPRLFEGQLPDFNLGTNHGQSCAAELQSRIVEVLQRQSEYSYVVNGRFVGGYITRNFGRPDLHRHAIQIELSQATYLDEATLQWDPVKAMRVRLLLQAIISAIIQWN